MSLKEFKENYPNMFKEHIASRVDLENDNDCIVKFAIPNKRERNISFVYIDGYFHIQGDYGCASFTWWNKNNTIEQMADLAENVGYFLSKCQSSKENDIGTPFTIWDQDKCIKETENHIKIEDDVDDYVEIYELSEWKDHTENYHDWISFLREHGNELLGEDHFEWSCQTGFEINNTIYIMIYGLREALNQLQKKAKS